MNKPDGASYAKAGVSLEKADSFLGALLTWVRKTEELPGLKARSLIPNGYYATVLDVGLKECIAFSTDGVGSKILVAEAARDYSGIGIDCIAMNVNDILCVGARPVSMVDYLAIQDPPNEVGLELGKSLYEGCRIAGISIPGGELAQLPEMIRGVRPNEGIDLAGAAIGLVNREEISDGQGLLPGDVLIGIESNGLHSNGFTLARKVLLERARLRVDQHIAELGCTLGKEMLRPTHIYVPELGHLRAKGLRPKAMLHITGGGLLNLLRVSSDNIAFVIDTPPMIAPIFQLIQKLGEVSDAEMHRVFNMGVGMVLVLAPDKTDATLRALAEVPGPKAFPLGHLAESQGRVVRIPGRRLASKDTQFIQG